MLGHSQHNAFPLITWFHVQGAMEKANVSYQSTNRSHSSHVCPDIRCGQSRKAVDFERFDVKDSLLAKDRRLVIHCTGLTIEHGGRHERQVPRSEGSAIEEAEAHDVGEDDADP